jgi:hypothetical protein
VLLLGFKKGLEPGKARHGGMDQKNLKKNTPCFLREKLNYFNTFGIPPPMWLAAGTPGGRKQQVKNLVDVKTGWFMLVQ